MTNANFLFLILLCFCRQLSFAQGGCKDPAAFNYNPSATYNDGSCIYSTASYTPPVKINTLSDTLQEISGLQMAGDFLWGFNDGGGAAAIYRIDTTTGHILQTVTLGGATNVDCEDIAFDGSYFYIGDFGNNANGARTDLKIYKFPLALIPDYISTPTTTISSSQIDVINFTYSNQTTVTPVAANSTKWDCEAMIVDSGKIHLFSKNWVDVNTTHYVINSTAAGTYVADSLETLATNYLVTCADKNASGMVVLLGYQVSGFYNHFLHILSDFNSGFYFNGNKRRIDLPNVFTMGQAEGICFRNETYGYISNERISSPFTVTQKLRSFNLQSFIPVYVALPVDLLSFNATSVNSSNKLSWRFSRAVKKLNLLSSENGVDFKPIANYTSSASGTFYHNPSATTICYQLEWQWENERRFLSNVICVNNNNKGFQNIVLHSNGELSFVSSKNETETYLIRLLTTDGRIVAQESINKLTMGRNSINFAKVFVHHQLYILQMLHRDKQQTILLKITD